MLTQSKSWVDMTSCNFKQITAMSLLPKKWRDWSFVIDQFGDSIIKPVNMYAGIFGEAPELISIKDNIITLAQHSHADIYLLINYDKTLYALDKPHQRQFYMSNNQYNIDTNNFLSKQCFRMYMPWIIDYDVDATVYSETQKSFNVIPKKIEFKKQSNSLDQYDANFIDFYFTNNEDHMIEDDCGIIQKGSYMYTISFTADDILLQKILDFYDR